MKRYLALLMSAALVGIDQWLKLLAKEFLKPGETTPLIQDVLHLTYLENRGAAFGMMQNKKWLLVWATAAVLLILILAVMAGKIKGTFPLFSVWLPSGFQMIIWIFPSLKTGPSRMPSAPTPILRLHSSFTRCGVSSSLLHSGSNTR